MARIAAAVLALCCICWGYSFPVNQMAIAALASHVRTGPGETSQRLEMAVSATFLGWRFGLAALFYWLLTRPKWRDFSDLDRKAGAIVGLFHGGGMLLQMVGLRYILPSVSAFVTALAVVFAPMGESLLFRKRIGWATWLAVGVAIVGMLVLALPNQGATTSETLALRPPILFMGEALTILSSVFFTGQILAVGHYGKRASASRLTLLVFAITSGVNLVGGFLAGGIEIYTPEALWAVQRDLRFVSAILSLVLLSTILPLHLMNTYQPYVTAAAASVIYCLEPVFATVWSVLFKTEKLTGVTVLGGMIITAAVLIIAKQGGEEPMMKVDESGK